MGQLGSVVPEGPQGKKEGPARKYGHEVVAAFYRMEEGSAEGVDRRIFLL
jgi:hypothetical protein